MTDTLTPPKTGPIDQDDFDHGVTPSTQDKLVPVSEAIRYRKRAQTAEQKLEEINGHL